MEITDHHVDKLLAVKLPSSGSLRSRNSSMATSIGTATGDLEEEEEDHRYTSLKDIMMNSPTWHCHGYAHAHGATTSSALEGHDYFMSSSSPANISIRNELVKHAASAYLQSAAILASSRNQNCFVALWGRIDHHTSGGPNGAAGGGGRLLCWYWNVYVRNPLRSCFQPIFKCLSCMLANSRSSSTIPFPFS